MCVWDVCYFFAVANFQPFSANSDFFNISVFGQSRSTFYSELNELFEKNVIFWPKKGFFQILRRTFFRNSISFPTIYNTWVLDQFGDRAGQIINLRVLAA